MRFSRVGVDRLDDTYLIGITILKLEIDLIRRAISEWVLSGYLAISDVFDDRLTLWWDGPAPITKTLPPNLTDWGMVSRGLDITGDKTHVDSRCYGTLESAAFENGVDRFSSQCLDLLSSSLRAPSRLNLASLHTWNEASGKFQSGGLNIGYDNRSTARSASGQKGD